jgi:hypothetical protein
MASGVSVLVDGNAATLVDLSSAGAQVVSNAVLRPNQRVRVSLDGTMAERFSGSVAWASLEFAGGRPQYRVGIEFSDADSSVIGAFCERHGAQE